MTTIAYKDGVLAADKAISSGSGMVVVNAAAKENWYSVQYTWWL